MKNNRIRRLLTVTVAAVLVLCAVLPASAAATTAVDMRLEAVEGTVTLTNASGREMSVRDGMKLYSGYTVTTSEKSYAYLSLDNEKAVKMDANSSLEVRKQGKKLELLLKTGQILFDVKSPLREGETMNIRTSTMVTGIRGTIGIVSTNANGSTLTLLEGNATMTHRNGQNAVNVTAGNAGFSTRTDVSLAPSSPDAIAGFAATELAGNVALTGRIEDATGWELTPTVTGAQELLARDEAQAAGNSQAGASPSDPVYADVNAGMSKDMEKALDNRVQNMIQDALGGDDTSSDEEGDGSGEPDEPEVPGEPDGSGTIRLTAELKDSNGQALTADQEITFSFTVTAADGTETKATVTVGTGESSGETAVSDLPLGTYKVTLSESTGMTIVHGGNTYECSTTDGASQDVTLTDTEPEKTVTVTNTYVQTLTVTENCSVADLNGYLQTYTKVTVQGDKTTLPSEDPMVPIGEDETLTIPEGKTLVLENDGSKYIVENSGTIVNNGTLETPKELALTTTENAVLVNTGTVKTHRWINYGTINITSGGTFTAQGDTFVNYGKMTVDTGGQLLMEGLTNYGTIEVSGTFRILSNAWMAVNGSTDGKVGNITIKNGGQMINDAYDDELYEYICFKNEKGTINIETGATVTNNGLFHIYGGTLTNNGTIRNSKIFKNELHYDKTASTFTNNGTFTNVDGGTFTNTGTVNGTNAGQLTTP